MNTRLVTTAVEWFARIALSAAFLSAVADRFGWWGPPGSPNVAWGDWQHFASYSAKLNGTLPARVQPAIAWLATGAELMLGVGLLLPFGRKWMTLASGLLLMLFAAAMTWSLGIKAPLNYSVFTAAAAALMLASRSTNRIDLRSDR